MMYHVFVTTTSQRKYVRLRCEEMNHAAMSGEERRNLRTLLRGNRSSCEYRENSRWRTCGQRIKTDVLTTCSMDGARDNSLRTLWRRTKMPASEDSVDPLGWRAGMMASFARLYVGIRSIGEGATQQQSGGVVLSSGSSAWLVFETWVELHQYEHLICR